jgi:hypothetical protein
MKADFEKIRKESAEEKWADGTPVGLQYFQRTTS